MRVANIPLVLTHGIGLSPIHDSAMSKHAPTMFATLQQHQTPFSLRVPSCQENMALFHVITASKAGMITHTDWRDFKTGERGIIQECQGHADGFVDDSNIWRATVTCPFHSVTTFPPSKDLIKNDGSLSRQQAQAASRMASSTLFAANEANMLVPLRQQIIGKSSSSLSLLTTPRLTSTSSQRHGPLPSGPQRQTQHPLPLGPRLARRPLRHRHTRHQHQLRSPRARRGCCVHH